MTTYLFKLVTTHTESPTAEKRRPTIWLWRRRHGNNMQKKSNSLASHFFRTGIQCAYIYKLPWTPLSLWQLALFLVFLFQFYWLPSAVALTGLTSKPYFSLTRSRLRSSYPGGRMPCRRQQQFIKDSISTAKIYLVPRQSRQ